MSTRIVLLPRELLSHYHSGVLSLELSRMMLQSCLGCRVLLFWPSLGERKCASPQWWLKQSGQHWGLPQPSYLYSMALPAHSWLHYKCFALCLSSSRVWILMMLLTRRYPQKNCFFSFPPPTHLRHKMNWLQEADSPIAGLCHSLDRDRNSFSQLTDSLPTTNTAVFMASPPPCSQEGRQKRPRGH